MYSFIKDFPSDRENGWSEELQGVTTDGSNWYFSQRSSLWKFPVTHNLNKKVTSANPQAGILKSQLDMQGFNHFGDIDYFDNKLFVPIEGNAGTRIGIYSSADLRLIAFADLDQNGLPWCAVNPNDGLIYTSVFDNVTKLSAYSYNQQENGSLDLTKVSELSLVNDQDATLSLNRVQGGVFSKTNQLLYLVSDSHDGDNGIYVIDTSTGRQVDLIRVNYDPTIWGRVKEELEGITIWDLDNENAPNISGQLHLIMIDNFGTGADDLYFKHFTASNEKAALVQDRGKLTFLRVHDVGTKYGPPSDQIDVEVVIKIDSRPDRAMGFQLRNNDQSFARQGMLSLLRDAFKNNYTVIIDYKIDLGNGKKNGLLIRVALAEQPNYTPNKILADAP